jgi:heme A synthase
MNNLRRLAVVTALLTFALIVLGGVVRITGSGMGCGDDWPLCNGRLIPSLADIATVIEWGHRLVALLLSLMIAGTALLALALRSVPGVAGPGGPLRSASLAAVLLVVQVMLGAITVWLELPPAVIVLHLSVSMGLLASLIVTALRAGPDPAAGEPLSPKSYRGIVVTAGLVIATLLLGGLTANLNAGPACQGFPFCNGQIWPTTGGGLVHVHWTHRLLAYGLFFHAIIVAVRLVQRNAPRAVQLWGKMLAVTVTLQVIVAAGMVSLQLPPFWRAAHVAAGTAVWACAVVLWRYAAASRDPTI